ncbi:MAG: helicase HerA domain-containing protein [Candidatus Micrarchaeia archaeon]
MENQRIFLIQELPEKLDHSIFIKSMLGLSFGLYHDFKESKTYLLLDKNSTSDTFVNSILGFKMVETDFNKNNKELLLISPYFELNFDEKKQLKELFTEAYELFSGKDTFMSILFIRSDSNKVSSLKEEIENRLSIIEVKKSNQINFGIGFGSRTESNQYELFYNSAEKNISSSILNMLNEIILANSSSYHILISVERNNTDIISYLKSKVMFIKTCTVRASPVNLNFSTFKNMMIIPFSEKRLESIIFFSNSLVKNKIINTPISEYIGDIAIGTCLEGSIKDTKREIFSNRNAFNLGTLVTGVPGTGKTSSSMYLISQILSKSRTPVVVISPTEEWNNFALENNLEIITLYDDKNKLSFFNCPENLNIEKFYENLAMLISSASNSGPYKNAMEKCLLSAFSNIYEKTKKPEPEMVYSEIFDKVVERHGKISSTGIKLTKHGENIIAALEPLRLMLKKAQFAYADGLDINSILKKGVVFNLFKISNTLKPFFYALILNQIYGLSDTFDIYGDESLRMLICLEEAQLIFNDDESAASFDMLQRIQDFRKKGIGLFLITHNVSDINLRIRRLCQLKFYFRQSSDSAKMAFNDLLFPIIYSDDVVEKLKMLESGTCAITPIKNNSGFREVGNSLFIKPYTYLPKKKFNYVTEFKNDITRTLIIILDKNSNPIKYKKIRVYYLKEIIFSGLTSEEGAAEFYKIPSEKNCELQILGDKKKDTLFFIIISGRENTISI